MHQTQRMVDLTFAESGSAELERHGGSPRRVS